MQCDLPSILQDLEKKRRGTIEYLQMPKDLPFDLCLPFSLFIASNSNQSFLFVLVVLTVIALFVLSYSCFLIHRLIHISCEQGRLNDFSASKP